MTGQGHQTFADELARFAVGRADSRVTAIAERAAAPLRVVVRGRPGVGGSTVARALDRAGIASGISAATGVTPSTCGADGEADIVVYVITEVVKPAENADVDAD